MKPSRSPSLEMSGGPLRSWVRFWFTPVDPSGLALLRIACGLLLLAWLLPLSGHVQALYGLDGWFDRQAYVEASRMRDGTPKPISWSLLFLVAGKSGLLLATFWASIGVIALFTCGVATRLTSVLVWLIVASFTASPALDDEVEPLLHLLTLYLMVGHLFLGLRDWPLSWPERILGSWWTVLGGRWFGLRSGPVGPSVAAGVAIRLIQVHFALVLFTSGLHKLQFGDWWAGLSPWFSMHPPLTTSIAALRKRITDPASYIAWVNIVAYAALVWQVGFPLFAWRAGWWRFVLLGGAVVGWVGCVQLYQMPLFGPAMVVSCLAFITPEEWQALGRMFGTVSFLRGLGAWLEGQEASPAHASASAPAIAPRLAAAAPVSEGVMR